MLLVAPNPTPWRANQSLYMYRIDVVEINRIPRRRMEDNSTPIQLLSPLLPVLLEPPVPMSLEGLSSGSSTVDSVEL